MPLEIVFDHAQQRVGLKRLTAAATAAEFQGTDKWSDVWVDPVGKRLMLKPAPTYASWRTSNSGAYAKLALSSFTATGTWETVYDQHNVGPWLKLVDQATTGTLLTTTTYSKNRGFYLAFHVYGSSAEQLVLKCGWNSSASDASGVSLQFYTSGRFNVLKDGVQVGQGQLSGVKGLDPKSNAVFEVMLIPGAIRELGVIGLSGGNGEWVAFEDILETDTNPTITGATKFWVESVAGGAMLQIAPLLFAASGFASSNVQTFIDPPGTGETLAVWDNATWAGGAAQSYLLNGAPAFVGTQTGAATLRTGTDSGAFTPDDVAKEYRVRVTLTTDNTGYTPIIYNAQLAYPGILADTDGTEEVDITEYVIRGSFSVPEDPAGVGFDLELKAPDEIETDHVAKLKTLSNRPVSVRIDNVEFVDGVAGSPAWGYAIQDQAQRLTISIDDRWALLEKHRSGERMPIDGLSFENAVKLAFEPTGIAPADMTVSSTTLDMASVPGDTTEEFNYSFDIGDTGDSNVRRLMDDFAGDWWYGIKPTATGTEVYATAPDDLPTTSAVTLYETIDDAVTIGLHTIDEAPKFVYRSYHEEIIPPEATQVRVTGYDPRRKTPIQAVKIDTAAETVTTVPSSRPDNWAGAIHNYVLVHPGITNQAILEAATELLYDQKTKVRRLAEIECELQLDTDGVPLWRGDVIELYGRGDYRINSFGAQFEIEHDVVWRPATYTLEKIADWVEPE